MHVLSTKLQSSSSSSSSPSSSSSSSSAQHHQQYIHLSHQRKKYLSLCLYFNNLPISKQISISKSLICSAAVRTLLLIFTLFNIIYPAYCLSDTPFSVVVSENLTGYSCPRTELAPLLTMQNRLNNGVYNGKTGEKG